MQNSILVENYPASIILNVNAALKPLKNFIDNKLSFEAHKQELNQAYRVAKCALDRFSSLEYESQQAIIAFAQHLTQQKIERKPDSSLHCYQSIIQLWAQCSYLQTALGNISIFLTPARLSHSSLLTEKQLEHSQHLAAFAVKHFQYLSQESQQSIQLIKCLFEISPLPILQVEPQLSRYQFLKNCFKNSPTLQPQFSLPAPFLSPLSRLIWKQPDNPEPLEHFVFIPGSLEKERAALQLQEKKESEENQEIQKRQLDKICQIYHNICRFYFPFYSKTEEHREQILQQFDQHFRLAAQELFFHSPSLFPDSQFYLIYHCLSMEVQFLKEIGTKNTLSLENIDQQLTATLQQILLRLQSQPSALNAFFSFMSTQKMIEWIDQFIQTDGFYFILERLLSPDPWDFQDFNQHKIPTEHFLIDQNLTALLGESMEALGQELILLGNAKQGSTTLFCLNKILSWKKEALAKSIQMLCHQNKSLPCDMLPSLILYRLLFRSEQDQLQATWLNWKNLSPEQKKTRKQLTEAHLNDILYKYLIQEITAYNSIGGWMAGNLAVQQFCNTLTQKLWQLFQEEKKVKLMIINLLEGLEKAIPPSNS